ncbi:MAG: hypothetical protein R6V28_07485, partial [Nitriliruptoraceae bacterium]
GGELEGELSQRSSVDADSRDLIFNATVSNVIWVAQPVWSVGEPGTNFGLCRGWRYVAATSEEEADSLRAAGRDDFETMYDTLLSWEFPDIQVNEDCPGDQAAAVPAVVLRDAVRAMVVGQLPRPELAIAPGFALAGLETYLDTGGAHDLLYLQNEPILLGPFAFDVEIEATGQTTVDWGDGSRPVTYTVPGQPYPDGEIRHTYRDAATVTVTVTDRWRIDFRATTANGTVLTDTVDAELEQVLIEDFEVREYRAVRTRS